MSPPAAEPAGRGLGLEPDARAVRAPARGDLRVPARRRLRHPRLRPTPADRTPTRASSTCSPRPSAGEGARTSAHSCRARSRSCGAARAAWSSCSKPSVPAPRGSASCATATDSGSRARSGSASRRRATDRRPLLVGGGVGTAPLAIWQDGDDSARGLASLEARPGCPLFRRVETTRPLGFRDEQHAAGASLCATRASPPTTARSATRVRSPTSCSPNWGATLTSRFTPAVRPGCSRPCARSAPSTGSPRSSRSSPGMACGYGACFGCVVPTRTGYVRLCVDGPVLDASTLISV